jgi:hypothetical protein
VKGVWVSLLFIAVLGLTGCSADFVATRGGSRSPYVPVNEKERLGGIIKLNCGESDFVPILEKCIAQAEEKIKTYCGGAYRITQKSGRLDGQMEHEEVEHKIFGYTVTQTRVKESLVRYLFFDCNTGTNP